MSNNILQQKFNTVNENLANVFSLGVKDRATQECDLSVISSPPGVNTLAISISGDKQLPGSEDNSWGVLSDKLTVESSDGDPLKSETLNLLSEDSVLQYINRHISALDINAYKMCHNEKDVTKLELQDKLENCYLEFLDSHKSFSTCDIEYYVGVFVSFLKAGADIDKACRFLSCGTQVSTLECCACGYQHAVPYNCKLRICPRCGAIRASELVKKHQPYLETLDPRRVRCITLTMKNVVCLWSGVSKIRRCYGKLLHRKYYKEGEWHNGKDGDVIIWGADGKWHDKDKNVVKLCSEGAIRQGKIEGSLYHIEATVGRDGLWHVHLHSIIVGDYIPQDTLSKDWEDVTEDKKPLKNKPLKDKDFDKDNEIAESVFNESLSFFSDTDDSMVGGVVNVETEKGNRVVWIERKEKNATLKYCMKHLLKKMKTDSRWTSEKLVEYEMALSDVRLIQATGCFLGTLKDYKKETFACPECGESIWRILDMDGNVIYSPLDRMINDWDREKLPSTPRMNNFVSDG